jgi:hypothetical protein
MQQHEMRVRRDEDSLCCPGTEPNVYEEFGAGSSQYVAGMAGGWNGFRDIFLTTLVVVVVVDDDDDFPVSLLGGGDMARRERPVSGGEVASALCG